MAEMLSGVERLQNKLLCMHAVSFVAMMTSESENCENNITEDRWSLKQMNSLPIKKIPLSVKLQTIKHFLM